MSSDKKDLVPKPNAGQFVKGRSGNPSGKSKLKPLTDRLRMILTENPKRAHNIAEALIGEAEKGNLQAAAMVFDRLEGKPLQAIEVSDARQNAEIAEIDGRIRELMARLRVDVGPMLDVTPVQNDSDTKH